MQFFCEVGESQSNQAIGQLTLALGPPIPILAPYTVCLKDTNLIPILVKDPC